MEGIWKPSKLSMMDGWSFEGILKTTKLSMVDGWLIEGIMKRRDTKLSIASFEIGPILKILLLISQDRWTYTMHSAHNRLWGRVCMLILCWLISILKNICVVPTRHRMLWSVVIEHYSTSKERVEMIAHMKEFPYWLWPCLWDLVVDSWGGSGGIQTYILNIYINRYCV